jgi:hypothetical protein
MVRVAGVETAQCSAKSVSDTAKMNASLKVAL